MTICDYQPQNKQADTPRISAFSFVHTLKWLLACYTSRLSRHKDRLNFLPDLFDVDGLDRLWHRQRGQLQNRHRRRRLLQRQRSELGELVDSRVGSYFNLSNTVKLRSNEFEGTNHFYPLLLIYVIANI